MVLSQERIVTDVLAVMIMGMTLIISIFFLLANQYWAGIASFWLACAFIPIVRIRNPLHPVTLVPLFYAGYATFYIIHSYLSMGMWDAAYFSMMLSAAIGIFVFVSVCLLLECYIPGGFPNIDAKNNRLNHSIETLVVKVILYALIVATSYHLLHLYGSGYSSKKDILAAGAEGERVLFLRVAWNYLLLVWTLFIAIKINKRAPYIIPMALFFSYSLIGFLVTGERNIIIVSFICIMILSVWAGARWRWWYLYLGFIVLAILLPILQSAKALIIAGWGGHSFHLMEILREGFYTSGRTFFLALQYAPDGIGSDALLRDVRRVFGSNLLGVTTDNMTVWFNQTVRPALGEVTGSGWGFSYLGAAYMFSQHLGVAIYMAFAAFVSMISFRFARRSIYGLSSHAVYMTVLVYIFRADLANYINMTLKSIWVPMIMIFIAVNVLRGFDFLRYRSDRVGQ